MSEAEAVSCTVPPPAGESPTPEGGHPDEVIPLVVTEMELPDGRYLIAYSRAAESRDA